MAGFGAVRERVPELVALALPVAAGLGWMAASGAPDAYLAIQGAALALGLIWIALAPPSFPPIPPRIVAAVLLLILAAPLVTGPHLNGVARWLPLGPVTLHAGMLVVPLLVRIAAAQLDDAPIIVAAGLLIALVQPDAATAAALTCGAIGLYQARPDWKIGMVGVAGFFIAIHAALHGELRPQSFVERVLLDAAQASPMAALGLFAALACSFALMLSATDQPPAARWAAAGTLFGFAIMAQMNVYPFPLIGFGAAPIIGYALALGPQRRPRP